MTEQGFDHGDDDGIPMDPVCPRCGGKHGVEVSGDGYEWDCAACHQHLICAIGPDGGEMYPYHREDGSCGCEREPHTCDDYDTDGRDVEDCIADDSTECDCARCTGAQDRFWREQGEGADDRSFVDDYTDQEPDRG